ncbi:Shikimate dehydrogenase [Symmachiella dynata]|uniref:type I 3-dehydroquinate dehydratase n=1 Tax=Symmachiella dynata TaxID=2527995 RepID=UPI00118791C0|nr:type I 3-dehydroquinate dehydratase [Symmachiella dynata]QDT51057.1 Shikimate dehydrogenase [Symmachiella dynata]
MICIPIAPESHTLARADLYNAEPQCDVVEIRLDCLHKTPNVAKLIEGRRKPVMISCRRQVDGGSWNRDEAERVTVLRQAIADGPEFVDIDVDIAAKIPRYGPTMRIVSFTHSQGSLPDLKTIYQRACDADADMVRFTAPTPTLEAAWPLLLALNFQGKAPVIVSGTGDAGLTLALTSCKLGSPFIYAALEQGMEVQEGQVSVRILEETYRWRDISQQTHLVAVMGFDAPQTKTVRALNAAFAYSHLNIRCLPVETQLLERMMQMLEKLHIKAALLDPKNRETMLRLADHIEKSAEISQQADMLLKSDKGWTAYSTLWRSALKALETTLGPARGDQKPLDHRNVLVVGANSTARAAIYASKRRDTILSITAGDDKRAQLLSQLFNLRYVPTANVFSTLCDVIISTESEFEQGRKTKLPASFLRDSMAVMDLDGMPQDTPFIKEARSRFCKVVEPVKISVEQLASQFTAISGQPAPLEVLETALKAE